MRCFTTILLIFILISPVHADTLKIGTIADDTDIKIYPDQTIELDAHIFNIGTEPVTVSMTVSDNGIFSITTVPDKFLLQPSNPTTNPKNEKNMNWWVLSDGKSYVPLKKIKIFITAPDTTSLKTNKNIFNPTIHISAKATTTSLNGMNQKFTYIRDIPLTIELINHTVGYFTKNTGRINLEFGEGNINQNQEEESAQNTISSDNQKEEEYETKYGPLININETKDKTQTKDEKKDETDNFTPKRTVMILLGILTLTYLYLKK